MKKFQLVVAGLLLTAIVSGVTFGQARPPLSSDAAVVHIAGTETVTGTKTFTGILTAAVLQANGDVTSASSSLIPRLGAASGAPGLWLHGATPSLSNYAMLSDGTGTIVNGPSGSYVELRIGNSVQARVDVTNGIRQIARTMPTCSSANEWAMLPDALSGIATGKRSKMCLCTSSGASVYVWQNMVTATLGTATTCGTE